jgi:hypothetical protein
MWRRISACVLSSVCLLSACDKSDKDVSPPPTSSEPVKVPVLKSHPSTAQLANRTNLEMKFVPLSLMVPEGWGMKSRDVGAAPLVTLEGATPDDEVRIRIPSARTIDDAQETLLEANAADMQARHPELFNGQPVRDISGGKVIEQLVLRQLAPATEPIEGMPKPAVALPSTTQPVQTVQWTFTVCIPAGKSFTAYDLSLGMTLDEYKKDSAFLRSILSTLQYDPAAASTPGH